jgi:hypothetical protein
MALVGFDKPLSLSQIKSRLNQTHTEKLLYLPCHRMVAEYVAS